MGPTAGPNLCALGLLRIPPSQAVEDFLNEKIGYLDIMRVVEECCEAHRRAGAGAGASAGGRMGAAAMCCAVMCCSSQPAGAGSHML